MQGSFLCSSLNYLFYFCLDIGVFVQLRSIILGGDFHSVDCSARILLQQQNDNGWHLLLCLIYCSGKGSARQFQVGSWNLWSKPANFLKMWWEGEFILLYIQTSLSCVRPLKKMHLLIADTSYKNAEFVRISDNTLVLKQRETQKNPQNQTKQTPKQKNNQQKNPTTQQPACSYLCWTQKTQRLVDYCLWLLHV